VNFIVDARLLIALADWPNVKGSRADHISDLLGLNAPDQTIWPQARKQARIIASRDRDFAVWAADLRYGSQIVWLRLAAATRRVLMAWFEPKRPLIEQRPSEDVHLIEVRA
jgi:predicted nuclease of predicted toxin-antitoxin system